MTFSHCHQTSIELPTLTMLGSKGEFFVGCH